MIKLNLWKNIFRFMRLKSHKSHMKFEQQTISNYRRNKIRYSKTNKDALARDLLAMKEVWEMLKEGTVKWFGEVGRQY